MKHEEYKEMLALEALGALGAEESLAIERHLAACSECRSELKELREVVATLAYTVAPVEPLGELWERVLDSVRTMQQAPGVLREASSGGAHVRGIESTQGESAEAPNVLPIESQKRRHEQSLVRRRPLLVFGAVAATIAVAALAAALAIAWNRNNQMRDEIARLSNRLGEAQAETSRMANVLTQTEGELERARAGGDTDAGEVDTKVPDTRVPEVLQRNTSPAADQLAASRAAQTALTRLSARNTELEAELARLSRLGADLRTELARLASQTGELQTRLAEATRRNAELQTELIGLSDRDKGLRTELARSSDALRAVQAELARVTNRNGELQAALAELSKPNDLLQNETTAQRESEQLLAAPDARAVALAGTDKAPQARARLAFDRNTGRAVFFAYNLPPPPSGKAYQLWFVAGGSPSSAGVFTPDAAGRAVLRSQLSAKASKASAFVVTLEDAPGSPKPTGSKYLKGST